MGFESRRLGFISVALCLVVLLLGLALLPQQVSFGQGPETPSSSIWQTYSATDPLLIYSNGTWQTAAQPEAQSGVVNSSISPGATLTVTFEGTAVRLFYSVGPEGQTISSQLDDGSVTTVYSYGDSYSYGNVLPYVDLTPGRHVLTVTNGQGTIWIEAVQVKGALLSANATASPQVTSETTLEAATATPTPTGPEEVGAFQPQAASALQALADVTVSADNVADLIYEIAHANCANHTIIELVEDGTYSLTSVNNTSSYGANGLPIIQCTITINGNGSIIQRSISTKFRIFDVRSGGTLTLSNVTIQGGSATDTGGSGILSVYGTVHLFGSKVQDNVLDINTSFQMLGAGIYSYYGTLTIDGSEISGNSNTCQVGDGGGVGVIAGNAHITNSSIHDNSTTRDGGGIAMLFNSLTTAIINDSEIVNNNRIAVFANWGANARKNWWGSSYGPQVDVYKTLAQGVVTASVEVVESDSVNSAVQYYPFKISIVSTSPGMTQEALDMQSVASESGVCLHNGPTLNAKRQPESIIPWGSKVIPETRLEFPQTSLPSQVWYQVETDEGEEGWIAIRMEDKYYIDSVTTDSDPLEEMYAPSSVSFEYNRQAAAEYAIAQATENNTSAPPDQQVSRRIEDSPYAYFLYDALSTGTGSAVFVSEAIWMGGLPMTVGDPTSCDVQPGVIANMGWRYCPRTGTTGLTSPPWDFHESLGEYFTDATLPPSSSKHPNNTIADKGSQVMFSVPPFLQNDRITAPDFSGILDVSGGGGITFVQEGISLLVRDGLGLVNGEALLQAGDYMWIDSNPYHGLVIVGWGLTQICSSALADSGPLFTNYVDALNAPNELIPEQAGVAQAVPYVADFLGYYPNNLQSPIPRPFYCTRYQEPGKTNFSVHDWYFYILPDSITLSPAELYVDPIWSWTSND
ncbi:hypothetical protein [Aggregatilinea lenta]|uniref:hypothetical protein n=1 Tax=Aggregatilinea lenta TaxID=913108 RepID=UPI0013C2D225|nr:hypothetical protein [Aggregatilinea lenta]